MPRGGIRPNSGPKSQWRTGPTKTIRVPACLAARLLGLARDLDRGIPIDHVTGSNSIPKAAAPIELVTSSMGGPTAIDLLRETLVPLPLDERARRLASHTAALEALQIELGMGEQAPVKTEPVPVEGAPGWLAAVQKQILGLPKHETRLMVMHLLLDHQAYTEERLRDHERRTPASTASDRAHAQWEQSRAAFIRRLDELRQFFATYPAKMLAEARAIRPNWGGRATVGARRAYDAIKMKIDGGPRLG